MLVKVSNLTRLKKNKNETEIQAVTQWCSVKKMFLEISQSLQENTCARVTFLLNFIKKETLAQVFSCQFYEIYNNNFSYRTPSMAASENIKSKSKI